MNTATGGRAAFGPARRGEAGGDIRMVAGGWLERARGRARALKRDLHAVWLAARHPATPRGVRWLALAVAAYALSPIDLIPDAVPVLGLLDDLLIVPLGLWLVLRLLPAPVLAECRAAARAAEARPRSRAGLLIVLGIWAAGAAAAAWWLWPRAGG